MPAAGETAAVSPVGDPVYPEGPRARDRFVLARRAEHSPPDPWRHQGVLVEDERDERGQPARVATVFLTGRECRWRCAMCDLWRHTIPGDTPAGAISAQLDQLLVDLRNAGGRAPTRIKLFNASSFFDAGAVPEEDYPGIAERVSSFDRVIVESHPALAGGRVDRFQRAIRGSLEVAMGLETVHPGALERLNKRMTLDQFARAADSLLGRGVAVRAFVLVSPPFVPREEQDEWLVRSVSFAFGQGATVVSLIPTRAGNGSMEALAAEGHFTSPTLSDLERSLDLGLGHSRERVFADLWDLERFAECRECLGARAERLRLINLEQRTRPHHDCAACGGETA